MGLLYVLVVGAIAGWLAGNLIKGGGFGLLLNIIIGIVGGFVGNWIFGNFGIIFFEGMAGQIITSVIGASVILVIASFFKK